MYVRSREQYAYLSNESLPFLLLGKHRIYQKVKWNFIYSWTKFAKLDGNSIKEIDSQFAWIELLQISDKIFVCWLVKLYKINFNKILISKLLNLSLCYAIKINDSLFCQSSHWYFRIYLPKFCLVQWNTVTLTEFSFYGSCLNLMSGIIWMHLTWKK